MSFEDSIKPSTALTVFNLGTGIILGIALLSLDQKIKDRSTVNSGNVMFSLGIIAIASIIGVGLISAQK